MEPIADVVHTRSKKKLGPIDLDQLRERHRPSISTIQTEGTVPSDREVSRIVLDIHQIRDRHRHSEGGVAACLEEKQVESRENQRSSNDRDRHRFSAESLQFWGTTASLSPGEFWEEFRRRESLPAEDVDAGLVHPSIQRERASGKYTPDGHLHQDFQQALKTLVVRTGIGADLKVEAQAILQTSQRLEDTSVPPVERQNLALRIASTTLGWVWGAVKATVNSETGTFLLNTGVHLATASTVNAMFGTQMPIVGQIAGTLAVQGVQHVKTALTNPTDWTTRTLGNSLIQTTFAVAGNVTTGLLTHYLPGHPVVQQFIGVAVGNTIQAVGTAAAQQFEGLLFGKATITHSSPPEATAAISDAEELTVLNENRSSILVGIKVAAVASAATLLILRGQGTKVAKIGWKYLQKSPHVRNIAVSALTQVATIKMGSLVRTVCDLADRLLDKVGIKDTHLVHKRLRDRLRGHLLHTLVERLTISGLVRTSLTITGQIGASLGSKYSIDKVASYHTVADARNDFHAMYKTAQTTVSTRLRQGKDLLEPSLWFRAIDRAYKRETPSVAERSMPPATSDFRQMLQARVTADAANQTAQSLNDFRMLLQDRVTADAANQNIQARNDFRMLLQDRVDTDMWTRAQTEAAAQKTDFLQAMHAPFDTLLQDLEAFQDAGFAEFDPVLHIDIVNAFNKYQGPSNKPPVSGRHTGVAYKIAQILFPLSGKVGTVVKAATSGIKIVKMTTSAARYGLVETPFEQTADTLDHISHTYAPDIWNVAFDQLHPSHQEIVDKYTAFNPIWQGFVASGAHPTTSWTNGLWKICLGDGAVDLVGKYFSGDP